MTFINLASGLDVWAVTSTLFKFRDELKADPSGEMVLFEANKFHERLDKWGSMRTFLAKCRRLAEGTQYELNHARIEQLQPGAVHHWGRLEDDLILVHVALVTNPGAILFHGNQSLHLPVGAAVAYGVRVWNSAINVGDRGRIHLVLELERREELTE